MVEDEGRPWLYDPQDTELLGHDPRWAQRRSIAGHLRRLKRIALQGDLDPEALYRIEQQLAKQVGRHGGAPWLGDRADYLASRHIIGPRNRLALEMSGVAGRSNAAALPLRFFRDDHGRLCAEADPDDSHEGPPGSLHGGLIAALFDEFLGLAQGEVPGATGLTGTLTVRYLRPTRLGRPVILRLGSARAEDRKRHLTGELLSGDDLTATCEALFILPRQTL